MIVMATADSGTTMLLNHRRTGHLLRQQAGPIQAADPPTSVTGVDSAATSVAGPA
jgi:hypothetical protein